MMMYSRRDVERIVENFLASHFGFDGVTLSANSKLELKRICYEYGIEVDNIEEQYYS